MSGAGSTRMRILPPIERKESSPASHSSGYGSLRPLQTTPQRILVGLLLPVGDTLLTTPALAALHRRFPESEITALVSTSNAAILAGNPHIARSVQPPTTPRV